MTGGPFQKTVKVRMDGLANPSRRQEDHGFN
jgi:hypothetical protein